ncbi:MAG TPA: aminotransferase class I/II-fold pyridoxal phosphate-dependent enzyme, partial [Clostridia bacterium]|nr:aminotransferase class I/II-fold pyridoxal phosphate-dependent enzyme [Clostridia bacterium]
AMCKIHQYVIMCAPIMSQEAAVEALRSGAETGYEDVRKMVEQYDMRRRIIIDELNDMGLSCFEPRGAFYVFPSIQSTGLTSEAFCERLLREQMVAVVPGNAFGPSGEGYVRCSYASSISNINEAMKRIRLFLSHL